MLEQDTSTLTILSDEMLLSERCVLDYWKTSTSEVGVRLKSVSRSGSVRNFWKLAQNESITVGLRRFTPICTVSSGSKRAVLRTRIF